MVKKSNDMWEVWGQTNALYTKWCSNTEQNPYQLFVLYALNAHEPVTQKRIADYTGLSKQTVSTVMRTLKEEGYVTLGAGESDRREKNVLLTEKGKHYAEEVLSSLYSLEQRVFEIIGEERMKQLSDDISLFNIVFEKEMEKQTNEHKKF